MKSINETLAVRSRLGGVLKTMINQRAPLQIDDPLNAGEKEELCLQRKFGCPLWLYNKYVNILDAFLQGSQKAFT